MQDVLLTPDSLEQFRNDRDTLRQLAQASQYAAVCCGSLLLLHDLPNLPDWELIIRTNGGVDRRRYNATTGGEVAGFMPGDGEGDAAGHRDIQVQFRDGNLQTLNYCKAAYDPLHFVLFHPHGERGWHPDLRQSAASTGAADNSSDEHEGDIEDLSPAPSSGLGRGRGRGGGGGQVVCITRLGMTPSDTTMRFTLRRLQFPVRPAFAMTVNKSQGQTLKMVGVYLPKTVFSRGQLYVALSRVGRWQAVRVLVNDGWVEEGMFDGVPSGVYTANVVYCEVLHN
eukprot:gene1913-biopygen3406